jgi:hypothetical protein
MKLLSKSYCYRITDIIEYMLLRYSYRMTMIQSVLCDVVFNYCSGIVVMIFMLLTCSYGIIVIEV